MKKQFMYFLILVSLMPPNIRGALVDSEVAVGDVKEVSAEQAPSHQHPSLRDACVNTLVDELAKNRDLELAAQCSISLPVEVRKLFVNALQKKVSSQLIVGCDPQCSLKLPVEVRESIVDALQKKGNPRLIGQYFFGNWMHSPTGKYFTYGTHAKTYLYSIETGEVVVESNAAANTVKWSPNGEYFTCGGEKETYLYCVETGQMVAEIGARAWDCNWAPSEQYLVCGTRRFILCDAKTGELTAFDGAIFLKWLNGKQFAFYEEGNCILYDAASDKRVSTFATDPQTTISWSSTAKYCVSGNNKKCSLHSVATGQVLAELTIDAQLARWPGFHYTKWSPTEEYFSCGSENKFYLCASENGRVIAEFDVSGELTSWSPRGTHIAYGTRNKCFLYNLEKGEIEQEFDADAMWVKWSPSGAHLVFGGTNGQSYLYSIESGMTIRLDQRCSGWSPTNEYFEGIGDEKILLGNLKSGRKGVVDVGEGVNVKSWSPTGKHIIYKSDTKCWLFNAETCEMVQEFDITILLSAWSSDGYSLFYVNSEGLHEYRILSDDLIEAVKVFLLNVGKVEVVNEDDTLLLE